VEWIWGLLQPGVVRWAPPPASQNYFNHCPAYIYIAPAEWVPLGIGYRRRGRMWLPVGRKSFKIDLADLIQYRRMTSSQPASCGLRFMVPKQKGSVLHLCTKFRSKVIRWVPKFRNWVTWPSPRPTTGRSTVRQGDILLCNTSPECQCSAV